MTPEVAAALIGGGLGLVGGAFSGFVAYLTTKKTIDSDAKRLRCEVEKMYADKILEKRVAHYPAVGCLLSNFIKVIRFKGPDKNSLSEFVASFQELDSKYMLFYSEVTTQTVHEFHKYIVQLSESSDEDIRKLAESGEQRKQLIHRF